MPLALTTAEVVTETLETLLPVLLLMVALVVAAILLFRRFVTQPIRQLQSGIEEIELGHYQLKLSLKGGAEFQRLGDQFGHMAAELQLQRQERQCNHEKLSRNYHAQKTLTAILEIALRPLPMAERMQLMLQQLFSLPWLALMPIGSIFRFDPANQSLEMVASQGMAELMQQHCSRVRLGHCLCGTAAVTRQLLYCASHHVEEDNPDLNHAPSLAHGHYVVPIMSGEELLGVLNLYLPEGHARSEAEEGFLNNVAHCLAGVFKQEAVESALGSSEVRLRSVFDHVADAIFIHDLDGRIQDVNQQACQRLGYSREALLGMSVADIESQFDSAKLTELWQTLGELPITLMCEHRDHQGHRFPVEVNLGRFDDKERELVVACARDVSQRQQAEEQLRKLSRVVEQSPISVVITNTEGVIDYVNPMFSTISGYDPQEVVGQNPRIFQSGQTPERVYRTLWRRISRGRSWHGELCNRKKNSQLYWERVYISAITDGDQITHFLALKEDISERKEYEQRLYQQANFDSLTGLPNRALAYDRLDQGIAQARRDDGRLALLFIDIDHFKHVNDSLGHAAGDELLKQVSERIKNCLRESDTLARLGGDEFTIILPRIENPMDAEVVAEKVLESCILSMSVAGTELFVSLSIGITCFPDDGSGAIELMKNADSAMYLAKSRGRNNFCFFTPAMNEEAQIRLVMETELRFALERREFSLHYQPLVDASGQVQGAEALLRWNNAKLGAVSPVQFIPLAEDIGLINEIGSWVLRRACQEAYEWIEHRIMPDFVAVNISGRQLYNDGFESLVRQVLDETGLPPHCLELEITEGILLDKHQTNLEALQSLSRLGVRLSIDDFGTGYSSLSYLQRYPFDTLKIDRAFIQDLESNAESAALVRAIISMAQSLGLKIVGEGVEQSAQLDILRALGCDLIQGYHYSPPLTDQDFRDYVHNHHSHAFSEQVEIRNAPPITSCPVD